jgi:hypothetical protein
MVSGMRVYWFSVVVDRLGDDFVEGMVVAEGFHPEDEGDIQPADLQYVVLARARSASQSSAEQLIAEASEPFAPQAFRFITDRIEQVVRSERRAAGGLGEDDVLMKMSFLGFKRDCQEAQASAMRILELAILRQWWQFWR